MDITEMEYWMSKSKGGYTREELQDAFDKICDQENWKDCIKATIPTSEYRKADVAAVAEVLKQVHKLPYLEKHPELSLEN